MISRGRSARATPGHIGRYFVWPGSANRPMLLVGGGSGVVPLMTMLHHRSAASLRNPTRLLYSSRSLEDVLYPDELERLASTDDGLEVRHTLTRSQRRGGRATRGALTPRCFRKWPSRK